MNQLVREFKAGTLALAPLTPTIGVEISGLDLSKPLDQPTLADLRQALLDWKVIFFRDQDITTEQHLAFARSFGDLEVHPFAPSKPGYPEVLAITHDDKSKGRENIWHSDVTWREAPSLGSILRAIDVPPVGGDTLFSDMYAAYDGLSDEVKARVEGKVALHDFAHFRKAQSGLSDDGTPGHPHPSGDRQEGDLRQRRLHPTHRRHGQDRVRQPAGPPLRPGGDPRISMPVPLEPKRHRLFLNYRNTNAPWPHRGPP